MASVLTAPSPESTVEAPNQPESASLHATGKQHGMAARELIRMGRAAAPTGGTLPANYKITITGAAGTGASHQGNTILTVN